MGTLVFVVTPETHTDVMTLQHLKCCCGGRAQYLQQLLLALLLQSTVAFLIRGGQLSCLVLQLLQLGQLRYTGTHTTMNTTLLKSKVGGGG